MARAHRAERAAGVALALAAAGLLLAVGRERAPASAAGPDAGRAGAGAAAPHETGARLQPADARRALPAAERAAEPRAGAAEPELVRVHGRVSQGGVPAAGCDVAFSAQGPGGTRGAEVDWDLCDGDGRYEVRLPPGPYLITSADAGDAALRAEIAGGRDELALDVALPLPPSPRAR